MSWAWGSPLWPGSGASGTCSPWRVETFKFSTDPELEAKVRDVVGLYLHPPENAVVLCLDEKSQVHRKADGRLDDDPARAAAAASAKPARVRVRLLVLLLLDCSIVTSYVCDGAGGM